MKTAEETLEFIDECADDARADAEDKDYGSWDNAWDLGWVAAMGHIRAFIKGELDEYPLPLDEPLEEGEI